MTNAFLTLAAEPAFLWWVAPLVTFAAVCVALATSVAALGRQDRSLEIPAHDHLEAYAHLAEDLEQAMWRISAAIHDAKDASR